MLFTFRFFAKFAITTGEDRDGFMNLNYILSAKNAVNPLFIRVYGVSFCLSPIFLPVTISDYFALVWTKEIHFEHTF